MPNEKGLDTDFEIDIDPRHPSAILIDYLAVPWK